MSRERLIDELNDPRRDGLIDEMAEIIERRCVADGLSRRQIIVERLLIEDNATIAHSRAFIAQARQLTRLIDAVAAVYPRFMDRPCDPIDTCDYCKAWAELGEAFAATQAPEWVTNA